MLRAGTLTHLEWLDLCANELELDGIVFNAGDLPREDADYLAQLKKLAADLGLSVAAVEAHDAFGDDAQRSLGVALALGAPLLVMRAPAQREDPSAWGEFADAVKTAAGLAKQANVTLALRNAPGTLCTSVADCKRLAKDVDSAWLRYALASDAFGASDDARDLLSKSVIAMHALSQPERFATQDDAEARALIGSLARFRGFIVLEADTGDAPHDAYHRAVERFAALRERALLTSAHSEGG